MYGNYMIVVCDILGFSKLVNSLDIQNLVGDVLAWFRKALYHSLYKNGFPENTPSFSEMQNHSRVGIAWFSDTLLLYTLEDSDENIRELLASVSWLLFENMLHSPTRLRAGISYGNAFIDPDNSLYVGKPIVEAYQLEESQQWSGGALTENALDRLPEEARIGVFADWWLVPYEVPLKGQLTVNTLAINWTTGLHYPGKFLAWSQHSDEPTETDWRNQPDVCEKWKNTKMFHDRICRGCKGSGGTF